ncbi:metallophosphoesterase [Oricola cellulosilytica]|uniref:metallophosphoesterase n=1 Tax=Oricola cellulosilytica TaxID=1429082 RepID=UPI001304D56A|nr:metallophosphoesterase [Oricola cellulosilytica]
MPLLFAIGDVHGRRDLLAALLAAVEVEAERLGKPPRLIFLGDIIDRGPESRQALDLVVAALAEHAGSKLILGNHEEFLLDFLDNAENRESAARNWFANGGLATLKSYKFGETERIDTIAAHFARDFPGHVAAMRAADWMVETERHVFVHGGIDPHVSHSTQDPGTTRWIRHDFLDWRGSLPKAVVHGHTPTDSCLPEVHPNRIALDTGAVFSGHLTCVIFDDGTPPRFLATDDSGGEITVAEVDPVVFG